MVKNQKNFHKARHIIMITSFAIFALFSFTQQAIWAIPACTLIFILMTHQAAVGLGLGSLLGAFHLADYAILPAIRTAISKYLFGALDGPWHISAIIFTLVLGAFAGVLMMNGGFSALTRKLLGQSADSSRRIEASAATLGILCFFDGLANSLLVGQIARPLYDRCRIPRARLAYIVDSTSSAVACLAFISTWIAMQLSLIQDALTSASLEGNAYSLFFQSIPQNYYCWFTLILVALTIWKNWNPGPMGKEIPAPTESSPEIETSSNIWSAIVPLGALIISILISFYLWDENPRWPITTQKIVDSFGGSAGPYALTIGSLIGLLTAFIVTPSHSRSASLKAASGGASSMLGPLIILVMAWSFGSMLGDLGTAKWLSSHLLDCLPEKAFPLAVFLAGALISVSTGSSWGTMGLLMPIALGTYLSGNPGDITGMPTVIAAVFSGAVFGDHCSPFSDTTIVSSFASGVSTQTHVKTQILYALVTAVTTAIAGFGASALGLPPLACLILGTALLAIIVIYSKLGPSTSASQSQP